MPRETYRKVFVEPALQVAPARHRHRMAQNAARIRDDIGAFVAQAGAMGKPVAITEFGCATHRGAAEAARPRALAVAQSRVG